MNSRRIESGLIKAGTKPGTILYTGSKNNTPVEIELISYDKSGYEKHNIHAGQLSAIKSNGKINWINLTGVHDTGLIEKIGEVFSIDPLILEDIATIGSRPKYDGYKDFSFILMSMLSYDKSEHRINNEQFSVIISGNCVITFLEDEGDIFDSLRSRIYENKGKIRTCSSSYLFYSLIDSIVDQYFYIVNEVESEIEKLETEIMETMDNMHSKEIYSTRRRLMDVWNSIWPVRDIINNLVMDDDLFSYDEKKNLGDVNDNIKQIMDSITTYREILIVLNETNLSNINNKMNRIMTIFTIISVIFMPLTFLTGVYGMNFHFMPELSMKWTYPVFWILCIVLALGMYIYFKKKNWFL